LEKDHLENAATRQPFNVMPQHAARLVGHVQELTFEAVPYKTFPAHADVMGDGSIVVVPLDGHTPGSVGVFVNLGSQRIFHVGDAINTVDALADLRGKAFYLARTDLDPARADAQVAQLAALHKQAPTLRFLPGHDRAAWERIFGKPGGCVPR
jgi:glyoxylase-like metal-dependent hydrolase (beta-lactamase superfamily II)